MFLKWVFPYIVSLKEVLQTISDIKNYIRIESLWDTPVSLQNLGILPEKLSRSNMGVATTIFPIQSISHSG